MLTESYIYLASPYWNEDPAIRQKNATAVAKVASVLLLNKFPVYCPIAMGCYIQNSLPEDKQKLLDNPEVWSANEDYMIKHCDFVLLVTLDGWEKSNGVRRETEIAKKYGKQVIRQPLDYFADSNTKLGFADLLK